MTGCATTPHDVTLTKGKGKGDSRTSRQHRKGLWFRNVSWEIVLLAVMQEPACTARYWQLEGRLTKRECAFVRQTVRILSDAGRSPNTCLCPFLRGGPEPHYHLPSVLHAGVLWTECCLIEVAPSQCHGQCCIQIQRAADGRERSQTLMRRTLVNLYEKHTREMTSGCFWVGLAELSGLFSDALTPPRLSGRIVPTAIY